MVQGTPHANCSPKGKPGRAKVRERAVTLTSVFSGVGLRALPLSASDGQLDGLFAEPTH